ncbi:MAG: EamA family transporter [Gemmatimonadota bacterium]|nr:EamA family transporter [Gemmatimonadota bacterium]
MSAPATHTHNKPASQPRAGVTQALLAAVLFGASTPVAKALLVGTSPQVLAGLLYLGSGIGLGTLWVMRRARGFIPDAPLTRRDLPWLAGAVLFGGVLAPLALMAGLIRTPASASSLLLNLEGVFTALIAWIVFAENVDRRIALGMFAIVAGGALLSWQGRLAWGGAAGPLLVVAACAGWAIDNNLTQKVSASDPVQIAALKGAVAGVVNLVIGLALAGSLPGPARVVGAMTLGLLSYGVSLVLYVLAMRSLGTARTGAYFSLAPFVGAAGGLLFWHDPASPLFLAAAALMALGLWLHLTERHEHVHSHEPLRHSHRHVHDAHHQHAHTSSDPTGEPHAHEHTHAALEHAHAHFPDIHHRHGHGHDAAGEQ